MRPVPTKQREVVAHMSYQNSAGGVVLNAQREMILVLQRNGVWSLPKGQIVEGETREEAARREIMEESGVTDVTYIKMLGSYARYAIDDTGKEDRYRLKRITVMLFSTTETELHPADPRIREARWVLPEEAVQMLGAPKDQEFLESVLQKL